MYKNVQVKDSAAGYGVNSGSLWKIDDTSEDKHHGWYFTLSTTVHVGVHAFKKTNSMGEQSNKSSSTTPLTMMRLFSCFLLLFS